MCVDMSFCVLFGCVCYVVVAYLLVFERGSRGPSTVTLIALL